MNVSHSLSVLLGIALLLGRNGAVLGSPVEQPTVVLSLAQSNPIVGEEVTLRVDLLFPRGPVSFGGKSYPHWPVRNMNLTLTGLEQAGAFELVKPLEVLVREGAVEPGRRGFRVNGLPGEVKLEHEPADLRTPGWDPARYCRRLTVPLRIRDARSTTIPAVQAAGEIYVLSGNRGHWESFSAASAPLTFAALDLRGRPDRPAGFSGIVGSVRVSAQASQTRMAIGTPFTLRVRLDGSGSPGQASAPDLAERQEFRTAFRVRHAEDHTIGGVREFTYVLRPLNAEVKEIPPVEVSYFDPKTKEFATARSEATPLEVTPATDVTSIAARETEPTVSAENADDPEIGKTDEEDDSFWALTEGSLAVVCGVSLCAWGVCTWRRRGS